MKSFKLALATAGALLFFFYACKKDATKTIDFKYGYFPIDTGHYVIYDVDSITYNSFYHPIRVDTIHFQIKEYIQAIYLDNTGTPTCRIEGYRRNTPNDPWSAQPVYVWNSNRYTTTAQKVEDNLRFIKLVFPPMIGSSWAGNSYIQTSDTDTLSYAYLYNWQYQYVNIDVPLQLTSTNGNLSLDSTLTVLQDSSSNLVNYIYGKEKYAKNVGLVYKQTINLAHNDTALQGYLPWPQRATDGFIYTMTAVSYKK